MNYEQLTSREWQMLSAYLDGQLGSRDRRSLESRLKVEKDLRQGLEELRRTRLLLRTAPRRRAPRNFTVTRAQAEAFRPVGLFQRRAYPAFRLASALASILLVIAFIGDFAVNSTTRNAAPVQDQSAPAASMEMATAAEGSATAGPEMNSMLAPEAPSAAVTETPGLMMGALPLPTLNPTEQIIQAMTAAPPGMGEMPTEPTLMDSGRSMVQLTPTPTLEPSLKAAPAAGPYPAPEERSGLAGSSYPAPEESPAPAPVGAERSFIIPTGWFRPVEITLALIALFTGVGAILLRRR